MFAAVGHFFGRPAYVLPTQRYHGQSMAIFRSQHHLSGPKRYQTNPVTSGLALIML
jgi:hypothetical protein